MKRVPAAGGRLRAGAAGLWLLCGAALAGPLGQVMAADETGGGAAHATAPAAVGGEVTCAVDGMKMKASPGTPSLEYEEKRYYFCTEDEKRTFEQNPARYIKK